MARGYSCYNVGMKNTQEILQALQTLRVPAVPGEYDLHSMIAQALARAGIAYRHEYRLAPRRRIDFLIGRIGLEVKKSRPASRALIAQLRRYLESEEVDELIVVVQRSVPLPQKILGKSVILFSLDRLWGVALP